MIIYVRSVQTHPVWIRRMVVMLQLKKWRRILFVISIRQSLVSKLQYVNRSRRRKRAIWRGWCTCFLFLSNGQGHSRSTHKLSSLHSRSSRRYFFWNISLPWDEVRIIKKKTYFLFAIWLHILFCRALLSQWLSCKQNLHKKQQKHPTQPTFCANYGFLNGKNKSTTDT